MRDIGSSFLNSIKAVVSRVDKLEVISSRLMRQIQEKGDTGDKGLDGKDGINGRDGKDGKDGINGIDGKNGKNGFNGADGRNGIDGKDAADGKDGKDGKNGKDGKDGAGVKSIKIVDDELYTELTNGKTIKASGKFPKSKDKSFGSISVSGGGRIAPTLSTVTSDYTTIYQDEVIIVTGSSNLTITLQAADSRGGFPLKIKHLGSGMLTLAVVGSNLIDLDTSLIVSAGQMGSYSGIDLQPYGGGYIII